MDNAWISCTRVFFTKSIPTPTIPQIPKITRRTQNDETDRPNRLGVLGFTGDRKPINNYLSF